MMHISIAVKTDDFRFLWLKKVYGFDPAVHCAKCLLGSYVKGLPFRGTKTGFTLSADVDMTGVPYLYLCGVAGRYADNLHLPLVPATGEEVCYEDERIRVHVQGARLLAIPEMPESVRSLLTPAVPHLPQLSLWVGVFSRGPLRMAAVPAAHQQQGIMLVC